MQIQGQKQGQKLKPRRQGAKQSLKSRQRINSKGFTCSPVYGSFLLTAWNLSLFSVFCCVAGVYVSQGALQEHDQKLSLELGSGAQEEEELETS